MARMVPAKKSWYGWAAIAGLVMVDILSLQALSYWRTFHSWDDFLVIWLAGAVIGLLAFVRFLLLWWQARKALQAKELAAPKTP
jgi:protein-S-isoprenylcysteine O-methyltransferase Ste14